MKISVLFFSPTFGIVEGVEVKIHVKKVTSFYRITIERANIFRQVNFLFHEIRKNIKPPYI